MIYGPKQIFAGGSIRNNEFIIIVETAIGGTGDHSGPTLNIFRVNQEGFTHIARQELFDAMLERNGGEVTSISGEILSSFCDVCAGPDAAEPEDNFYIPVIVTFGCDGLCITNTLNDREIGDLLERFSEYKISYIKDRNLKELPAYIHDLENRVQQGTIKKWN
jgi:hypothetical protein